MQKTNEDKHNEAQIRNESIPTIKNKRSQLEVARQINSAGQLQKLVKNDSPVFLAIVRSNDSPNKRGGTRGERSQNPAANFAAAHGITQWQKRKINLETGPEKDIISVKEREQQVLDGVPISYKKYLAKLIKEYQDIFPEKLRKGVPPKRKVQHKIEIDPDSKHPYRPPYRLGPAEQDELEEQIKDLLAQVSYARTAVRTVHQSFSCPRKTADGGCV